MFPCGLEFEAVRGKLGRQVIVAAPDLSPRRLLASPSRPLKRSPSGGRWVPADVTPSYEYDPEDQ